MSKKSKSLFLDAINKPDVDKLLNFSSQHKSKKSSFCFEELLKSLKQSEFDDVWQKLSALAEENAAIALEVEIEDAEEAVRAASKKSSEIAHNVLQTVVEIGILTFNYVTTVPVGLLQMAVFLHGILFRFQEEKDTLKNSISQLCEKFWSGDLNGKEHVGSNTVNYILRRSLRVKGTKADVKRAWALRHALHAMMTMEDVDVNELLAVMEQCVASPLYLSSPEGQRLLSFMFGLDAVFVETLHESVKRFLPNCSLKQSETYGKIYYNAWLKAWKDNATELREKLELSCIQDFMFFAVHVQRNCVRSLSPILRKVLSYFHIHKKDAHVSKMLRTLYEPILWRSLKAANGNIRANAAHLFFDVFPLEDPDLNIVDTEMELQRQLLIIKDLLVDEYPVIRCIAAIGVGIVMNLNWELVSHEMVLSYFKILVDDLACDSASADVRCAVIKSMKVLLENHLAMPTLKIVLPKMMGLFHDISEKVRIAFCNLLLDVKKVCSIKYWQIVPVDHLLARLEEDKPTVARLIVNLIYNSYIPDTEPEDYWLSRCIELIKMDRGASRVFFQHVHEFISLDAAVKFMVLACRTLHVYVQSKLQPEVLSKLSASSDDKENMSSNASSLIRNFAADGAFGFDNPHIVAGVVDAIAILWIGVQNTLSKPENMTLYKHLLRKFSLYMPVLLKHFKDTEVWTSIFYVCGFLPSSFIPTLSSMCISRLKSLPEGSKSGDYGTLLVCLCNQKKSGDVLDLIQNWISFGLNQNEVTPVPKKKRKSKYRESSSKQPPAPKPYLAMDFLDTVIEQPITRKVVLTNDTEMLKTMISDISAVCDAIEKAKKTLGDEKYASFLFRVFTAYIKIAVLLRGEDAFDADSFIRKQMIWASKTFFPELSEDSRRRSRRCSRKSKEPRQETETWKNLGSSICKDMLLIVSDVILIGFIKERFAEYMDFAHRAIKSEYGHMYIAYASLLLYQVSERYPFSAENKEYLDEIRLLMPNIFQSIITTLKIADTLPQIPEKDMTDTKLHLKELLISQSKIPSQKEALNEMLSTLHSAVLELMTPVISDITKESPEKIELPVNCTTLLSIVSGSTELLKQFSANMHDYVKEQNLSVLMASSVVFAYVARSNKSIHRTPIIKQFIDVFENEIEKFCSQNDGTDLTETDNELVERAKKELASLKRTTTNDLSFHAAEEVQS